MMQDKKPETEYLVRTVGSILPSCLNEISEKRPADPIEYMARWLYKYADSEIDRYNKCEWLRELELARQELERERKQREANLRAMRKKIKGLKSQLAGEGRGDGGEAGLAWRTAGSDSGSSSDRSSRSDDRSDMASGEDRKMAYRTLVIAPGADRKWNIQQLEARRLSSMKSLRSLRKSSGEVKSPSPIDSRSSPRDPRQTPRLTLLTEQDGEHVEQGAAGSDEGAANQAMATETETTAARRDPYFVDVTKLGSKRTRNPEEMRAEDKLTLLDVTLFPEGEDEPRTSFMSGSEGGSRRGSRAERGGPTHATWTYLEECGVLVCMHPVLGHLMSRQPPDTADFLDAWFSNDFKCMSVYDHELYTVCDGSSGSLKWSVRDP